MSEIIVERPKVIAVDFDGTLCENKWPAIGSPNIELIMWLKDWIRSGNKLILWTNRVDRSLEDAVIWCEMRGLKFDAVNENLPEVIEQFGGDTRKIVADHYIDDKCTIVWGLNPDPKVLFSPKDREELTYLGRKMD